jgi:hypothetical protein
LKRSGCSFTRRGREQQWFDRDASRGEGIEAFNFNERYLKGQKKRLAELTRPEVPFLAVAYTLNHQQLSVPAKWLRENFVELFPSRSSFPQGGTAEKCHGDPAFRSWAAAFLRHADLGITDMQVTPEVKTRGQVSTVGGVPRIAQVPHTVYEPQFYHRGSPGLPPVPFSAREESEGTRRLFRLLGPWYEVIQEGRIALVDELGTSMHPLMTRRLIGLFHDPEFNTKGAQLIFATHDTSLLSASMFRRDQIWFTDKDEEGSTDLYSLHDFHPRQGEAIERGYLMGKYKAIPYFGEFV